MLGEDLQEFVTLPTEAVVDVISTLLSGDESEREVHANALLACLLYNEGVSDRQTVVRLTEEILHMRDAAIRGESIDEADIANISRIIKGGEEE
tara:strand:- start:43159 stop:43440 length:282 start_codon:yes stop_codon:yes gene_type:complete